MDNNKKLGNPLERKIDTLDIDDDIKTYLKFLPDTFKQQYIFYKCGVGHSHDKAFHRAVKETFEINVENSFRIIDVINNEKLDNNDNFEKIKDLIFL